VSNDDVSKNNVSPGAAGHGVRRSIGARIARRGGWSRIDSAPGAGTRVMVSLPLAEVA